MEDVAGGRAQPTLFADRFRVEELIGRGGMGAVYRAVDHEDGSTIALKIIDGTTTDEARRFIREGRLLARLNHPAIVRLAGSRSPIRNTLDAVMR